MRSMSAFHVLAQCESVSMSDLLSTPSGHSLGSQPQDLRQQLAVFVPAESHPVRGGGRDAGGKYRLVECLLERDGVWRGYEGRGGKAAFSGSEVAIYMLYHVSFYTHSHAPLLSPISSLT